jgi:hypothetical protein
LVRSDKQVCMRLHIVAVAVFLDYSLSDHRGTHRMLLRVALQRCRPDWQRGLGNSMGESGEGKLLPVLSDKPQVFAKQE